MHCTWFGGVEELFATKRIVIRQLKLIITTLQPQQRHKFMVVAFASFFRISWVLYTSVATQVEGSRFLHVQSNVSGS